MSKLVLKTVAVTLGVVIFLSLITVGILAIFSPKKIGDISERLGNYSIACRAYSRQYEKDSGEISKEEVNAVYIKYAVDLIGNGKYQKATDYIIDAKKDGRIFGNDVLLVVKGVLEAEKNGKEEDIQSTIVACIDKINSNTK